MDGAIVPERGEFAAPQRACPGDIALGAGASFAGFLPYILGSDGLRAGTHSSPVLGFPGYSDAVGILALATWAVEKIRRKAMVRAEVTGLQASIPGTRLMLASQWTR